MSLLVIRRGFSNKPKYVLFDLPYSKVMRVSSFISITKETQNQHKGMMLTPFKSLNDPKWQVLGVNFFYFFKIGEGEDLLIFVGDNLAYSSFKLKCQIGLGKISKFMAKVLKLSQRRILKVRCQTIYTIIQINN